jgi:hypothetical protein
MTAGGTPRAVAVVNRETASPQRQKPELLEDIDERYSTPAAGFFSVMWSA